MGTGLIYAAIVAAWLAYLIPTYLKRHANDDYEESDPRSRFTSSIKIIREGSSAARDEDGELLGEAEVSTPLTRRAALAGVRRSEQIAASRRRRVLLVLLVAVTACLALSVAGLIPFWSIAIPGGLAVAFLGLARYSVKAMRSSLDAQVAAIKRSGASEEETLTVTVEDFKAEVKAPSQVKQLVSGLWEPIPVTTPTYVSKPLAPRTVRTIDLSGPDVTSSARHTEPPVADAQASDEVADVVVDELRKASGS